MVELAERRLGQDAKLLVADLSEPGTDYSALAHWSDEYTFDGHHGAHLLAPPAARDDGCIHRRRLPPIGH